MRLRVLIAAILLIVGGMITIADSVLYPDRADRYLGASPDHINLVKLNNLDITTAQPELFVLLLPNSVRYLFWGPGDDYRLEIYDPGASTRVYAADAKNHAVRQESPYASGVVWNLEDRASVKCPVAPAYRCDFYWDMPDRYYRSGLGKWQTEIDFSSEPSALLPHTVLPGGSSPSSVGVTYVAVHLLRPGWSFSDSSPPSDDRTYYFVDSADGFAGPTARWLTLQVGWETALGQLGVPLLTLAVGFFLGTVEWHRRRGRRSERVQPSA